MLRRIGYISAWMLWTFLIVAMVFPWHDFTRHTHWEKVAWLPFVSAPLKGLDMIGNVLLYVPFGYLGYRSANGIGSPVVVTIMAGLLSCGTEATQLYSHWRFPSTTDFICNVAGCAAGLGLARPLWRRSLFSIVTGAHT